jgi:hypothetical protein
MARIRHKHAVFGHLRCDSAGSFKCYAPRFFKLADAVGRRRPPVVRGPGTSRSRRPQSTTPPKAEYIRLATLAGHRAHLIPRLEVGVHSRSQGSKRRLKSGRTKNRGHCEARRRRLWAHLPALQGVIALLASCQI